VKILILSQLIHYYLYRGAIIPNFDEYYIPPQEGHTKSQLKHCFKKDQEGYFRKFPHHPDDDLVVKNFSYAKKTWI
jgi:hypothetical protein